MLKKVVLLTPKALKNFLDMSFYCIIHTVLVLCIYLSMYPLYSKRWIKVDDTLELYYNNSNFMIENYQEH